MSDPTADTILRHLTALGWTVEEGETTITAVRGGQRCVVDVDNAPSRYVAVCELAGMCGIDLED